MTLRHARRVDVNIDGRCVTKSLDVISLRLDRILGNTGRCLNVEVSQGLVGNMIRSSERTAGTDHMVGDVHRLLGVVVLVLVNTYWEGGKHDGVWLISTKGTTARQSLPEFFRDKRHHGMKQSQTSLESNPKSGLGGPSAVGVGLTFVLDHRLDQLKVDITKVVNPELVGCLLSIAELVVLEVRLNGIDFVHELGYHKFVSDGHLPTRHELFKKTGSWLEVGDKLESKASGIPKLVAEHSVTNNALDIKVDIAALNSVCEKSESESIGSTFRDTIGKVGSLILLGLGNFLRWKVAAVELGQKRLESATIDHLEGIDDVSERLGHLAPILVSDHCVQVHSIEGELVGELETHHNHPRDPEEQNVKAGL